MSWDQKLGFQWMPGLIDALDALQIERAVREGYVVRGLMVWTLIDNFEVRTLS